MQTIDSKEINSALCWARGEWFPTRIYANGSTEPTHLTSIRTMWDLAKRTAVVLGTGLLFAAAALLLYASRWVLIVFLFAIFFADLLQPLVSRMQGWTKLSRGSPAVAILETYAIVGFIVALLALAAGGRIAGELRLLGAELPALIEKVNSGQIAQQLGTRHGWSYETQGYLQDFLARHSAGVLALEGKLAEYIAAFAQNLVWFVLIPILAFFFLKDGRAFVDELVRMVERTRRQRFVRRIFEDLNQMVTHYVRAQLALAAVALVVYTLMFWLISVPYSFALSSIAGIMEFIPVVGPATAAVVVLGVCFLESYPHLLIMVVLLGLWRVAQDYVISPRVLGNNLEMHPLASIFAVLVGAEVWGVVGVYLSIPIMAGLRILWRGWQTYSDSPADTGPRRV